MSTGLAAIANELRRLQRNGVNRVFVEDDTMRLLVQNKAGGQLSQLKGSTSSRQPASGLHIDLRELVKEGSDSTPAIANPAQAEQLSKTARLPEAPSVELPAGDAATQLAWLRERVSACEVCREHLGENGQIVFGSGSPHADILFCGEAPDADEAVSGEAFVGKAGQLLTKIITAMGLTRESVYLTNLLKWCPEQDKPHGNRPPNLDEMRFCLPYLRAQIEIIQPKVIVALGNATVAGLLGHDPHRKMGSARGTWNQFENIPLMITVHPSYLLRNGTLKTKRMAWEDMLLVMNKCGLDISEKQRGFFLPKP